MGGALVTLSLLAVWISWRNMQRARLVHQHLEYLNGLEAAAGTLDDAIEARQSGVPRPGVDAAMRATLARLERTSPPDAPLPERLRALVASGEPAPVEALEAAERQVWRLANEASKSHVDLVTAFEEDAGYDLSSAIAVAVLLPASLATAIFLLRRWILRPLLDLGNLMTMLAGRQYRTVDLATIDPVLQPVFQSFNDLVAHSRELQQEHERQSSWLEEKVRRATRTLLRQHRELGQVERLAMVGELSASVAHELRNPLAGIQAALSGLRQDLGPGPHSGTLDLTITELKRVTRLLADLLGRSRHAPEPCVPLDLALVVEEALAFVRYQIADGVQLVSSVSPQLWCRLPEGGLRRAVTNLVINSSQALAARGGKVDISAEVEGEVLTLRICDDGPGYPRAILETGARPFATWREDGHGLGLATVRRFAGDLDGRLVLSNREPHGACASLQLPFLPAHA